MSEPRQDEREVNDSSAGGDTREAVGADSFDNENLPVPETGRFTSLKRAYTGAKKSFNAWADEPSDPAASRRVARRRHLEGNQTDIDTTGIAMADNYTAEMPSSSGAEATEADGCLDSCCNACQSHS